MPDSREDLINSRLESEEEHLQSDFSEADDSSIASDEDVIAISNRLLEKNKEAYEVLAK